MPKPLRWDTCVCKYLLFFICMLSMATGGVSWAQAPLAPVNVTATYQQAQNRTVLTWDAQGQYRVAADLRTNGTAATWRGKDVYAERQGQTPYRWGLQNIGSATWQTFGDELGEVNNAGGIWYFVPGLKWTNYTFEFDVRIAGDAGDDDGIGISWRYTDSNNYYHFYMCGRDRYSNCRISRFRRVRSGTTTDIQTWPLRNSNGQNINPDYSWVQNTVYRFRVITNGNNFQVWVRVGTGQFKMLVDYTETNTANLLATGAPGTYSFSQSNQRYDNFGVIYSDTETRAVQSNVLNAPFNTPWVRLSTQTFTQLLSTQITAWASNYKLTAAQVVVPKVYVDITNQTSMFEGKASTNGTNTTDTNPNSFPYGRALANGVRSYVNRGTTQLPGMPVSGFTHTDTYGPCNVRPGTVYGYTVRTQNPANQFGPFSAPPANITTQNAAPTIAAIGPLSAFRNTALTVDVLAQINDLDSPKSRLTVTENSQYATVTGTTIRFLFPTSFAAAFADVVVTVTDCFGASASRTVRVNLTNRPPVIGNAPGTSAVVGVAYTYNPGASDPDGDTPLTYTLPTKPATALINPTTGVVTWTPTALDAGKTLSFTISVCDRRVPPACTTRSWTVTVGNRPPVITSTAPTTATSGVLYTYPVTATDPDGGVLSYKLTTGPTGAVINPTTGALTWTPPPNSGGKSFPFVVQVCDNGTPPACSTQSWSVTVGNRPPVITSTAPTTATAGLLYTYAAKATDPDNDTLTWKLLLAPAGSGATINPTTGLLTWQTKAADAGKSFNFSIQVCDSGTPPLCATQNWTVNTGAANAPPQIVGTPPTKLQSGQILAYNPKVRDQDLPNDSHTWKLVKGPAGATVDPATGALKWTPAAADIGKDIELSIEVCDKGGLCATQTWKVRVTKNNAPPTLSGTPATKAAPGKVYAYKPTAKDDDPNDVLTFKLDKAPNGASIDPSTGQIAWTPGIADQGNTVDFTVTVCDKAGACASQSWKVLVTSPNRPPAITGTPDSVGVVAKAYLYGPKVTDPDVGDTHTWTLVKGPTGATINPTTGAVSWTPTAADDNKEHELTIRVCDDQGACATQTWKVLVGTGNNPPSLSGTPPTTGEEAKLYTYSPTATDADPNDTLTFKLDSAPAGATIDPKTGKINWTPPAGSAGKAFPFGVSVCDNKGSCATQTWWVKIAKPGPDNTPPVITSTPPNTGLSGQTYTYPALAQDPDAGDTQTWSVDKGPTGLVISSTGVVSWTPAATDIGKTFEVTIKVCDKAGDCATQTWTISIEDGNHPPQIDGAPGNLASPAKDYTFQPGVSDPDPSDAGKHKWSLKSGPPGATVDPATGALKWRPTAADVGKVVEFEIEVCDPTGACAQRKWKVLVTLGSTNNNPVIVSTPDTTGIENIPYTYSAKAVDPDIGDVLKWTLKSGGTGATIDPATGQLTWTPGPNDAGKTVKFTIEVCDQAGGCDTQTWDVNVSKGNGAPQITTLPPTTAYTSTPFVYEPKATDPEQDPLTWSLETAPPGATIDPQTGKISWTPGNADADKPVTFSVKVCDNGIPKQCATQTFSVTPRQTCQVDIDCATPGICVLDTANKLVCVPAGCADDAPKCATATDFCKDGSCGANPCTNNTCQAGEICRPSDGKCIKSCAGVTCQANEICIDGACIANPCATAGANGGPCATDETCDTSDANNPKCIKNPCNDKSCRHGRVCDEARCIDDPCASMTCPNDTRCVAGQCKDLLPCKVDQECPNTQVCIGDKCRDPGCYTQTPQCPANNVCNTATCKDNQCPQPGGQACKAGEFCRPVENKCIPTCAGVTCAADERCSDGQCAKDPCASKQCNAGESCVKGNCEADVCSGGNKCKHGRVCSKQSNRCIDDPCASITCPDATEACIEGQCIKPDCRFDQDCPNNELCVQRKCVPAVCQKQSDCKSGERCINGQCVPDACDGKTCPSGQYCSNGTCVPSCAGIFCTDKQICVDGTCLENPCAGKQCADGEVCQNGSCIKDLCKGQTTPCKDGRICRVDACVTNPCDGIKCPDTLTCNNGQCTGDKTCQVDIECAGDGVCIDKKCSPPQCYKDGGCQNGQLCLKARCTDNPCATKQCAANETCRPADGVCVPNCPVCASGETCLNGRCEADPCKDKQCAEGESCDPTGNCIKDACSKGGDQNCRYKRVCIAGCFDDPCANIQCPNGMTCTKGACTGDQPPSEATTEGIQNEVTVDTKGNPDGGTGDNAKPPVDDDGFSVSGGCGCQQSQGAPMGGIILLLLGIAFVMRRRQAE